MIPIQKKGRLWNKGPNASAYEKGQTKNPISYRCQKCGKRTKVSQCNTYTIRSYKGYVAP